MTSEFDVWDQDAPVIAQGDPEFGTWHNGVPVVECAPADNAEVPAETPPERRRAAIF